MRPAFALALALAALTATPAAAQFKLPKVKSPVAATAARAAGVPVAAASGPRTGDVAFDSQVLEITPGVVDRLVKGLAAEQQVAARVEAQDLEAIDRENEAAKAAHRRDRDAWEKKYKEWKRCTEGVGQRMQAAMGPAPTEADQKQLEAVAARTQAAKERGDMAEVMRLVDSLSKATMPMAQRSMEVSAAGNAEARTKCGDEPKEPPYPKLKQPLDYRSVREAGQQAAGMTDVQYSIVRERVVPFVVDQRAYGRMVYTEGEIETLKAKAGLLEPYAEVLKSY
jgi:hypothetical protein